MFSNLWSVARSGVIALAALSAVPASAPAAPFGPTVMPAVADGGTIKPTLVQGEGRDRSSSPVYRRWQQQSGPRGVVRERERRNFRGDFRRDGRRDFRRPYRHDRRYRDRDYWGPGIILNYSAPAYRYRAPNRARYANSAHVDWCYARYRSYRAYDNTYQPYNGPRRRCISPYV